MNLKKVSAGVILTDGEVFLTGIPAGKKNKRDIPKGGIDEGEKPIEAAIREVKEETNLDIRASQLEDLGVFKYTQDKDLHLFLMYTKKLPPVKAMKCTSTFEMYGKQIPEMVGFEYLTIENVNKLYTAMAPIVKKIMSAL